MLNKVNAIRVIKLYPKSQEMKIQKMLASLWALVYFHVIFMAARYEITFRLQFSFTKCKYLFGTSKMYFTGRGNIATSEVLSFWFHKKKCLPCYLWQQQHPKRKKRPSIKSSDTKTLIYTDAFLFKHVFVSLLISPLQARIPQKQILCVSLQGNGTKLVLIYKNTYL